MKDIELSKDKADTPSTSTQRREALKKLGKFSATIPAAVFLTNAQAVNWGSDVGKKKKKKKVP